MSLGERLKQLRESINFSQTKIAKEIGTNPQTWRVYEGNKSVPGGNVLEALARMGFNVNWILTGDGPIRLSEGEKNRLLFEEAHDILRKRVWDQSSAGGGLQYFRVAINDYEQLRSYVFHKEYMPTADELLELCRLSHMDDYCKHRNIDYEDYLSTITNKEFGRSIEDKQPSTDIDPELLSLVYEVIEEISSKSPSLTSSQKTELFAFVYQMNKGTKYTKDRLKRFIEAVCSFIEQGIDFNKLSDRKLNNIMIEIAHYVVRGGDD